MDFKEELEKAGEEATSALKKAAEDMKKYYDKGKQPTKQSKVGEKVYIEGKEIKIMRPMKKLNDM